MWSNMCATSFGKSSLSRILYVLGVFPQVAVMRLYRKILLNESEESDPSSWKVGWSGSTPFFKVALLSHLVSDARCWMGRRRNNAMPRLAQSSSPSTLRKTSSVSYDMCFIWVNGTVLLGCWTRYYTELPAWQVGYLMWWVARLLGATLTIDGRHARNSRYSLVLVTALIPICCRTETNCPSAVPVRGACWVLVRACGLHGWQDSAKVLVSLHEALDLPIIQWYPSRLLSSVIESCIRVFIGSFEENSVFYDPSFQSLLQVRWRNDQ